MSSVNKTENYGLSQFSANDQPTWMGDYSGDMQKIDTALGNSAKRTSDKFSESLPYAAGAYCIKDDLLYKFKSAKSAGAWDASKVQATTVMSEITGLTEKMEKQLLFRGLISGDLNRASTYKIQSGIYFYQSTSTISNAPNGANWGVFVQIGSSDYLCTQVIIDASVGVKTRKYSGSPASWSNWM